MVSLLDQFITFMITRFNKFELLCLIIEIIKNNENDSKLLQYDVDRFDNCCQDNGSIINASMNVI